MTRALQLALLALGLASPARAETSEAARYQRCIAQVAHNAQAALDAALVWSREGGGAPARHCEALALNSLGKHGDAAKLLQEIANQSAEQALRFDMLAQAGNAWILAGDPTRAVGAFSSAAQIAATSVLPAAKLAGLYADRARAYALQRNRAAALGDLDRSVALAPTPAALTLRARIRRQMHDDNGAAADIARALELDQDFAEAYLERGRLRLGTGDLNRAREDYLKASLLQKDGPVADEARAELAALDVKPER